MALQEEKDKEVISEFKDKTLLITGGTGSFGNAVLKRFLQTDIGQIRIFSRDEKKQDDMRHLLQQKYPEEAVGDEIEACKRIMEIYGEKLDELADNKEYKAAEKAYV